MIVTTSKATLIFTYVGFDIIVASVHITAIISCMYCILLLLRYAQKAEISRSRTRPVPRQTMKNWGRYERTRICRRGALSAVEQAPFGGELRRKRWEGLGKRAAKAGKGGDAWRRPTCAHVYARNKDDHRRGPRLRILSRMFISMFVFYLISFVRLCLPKKALQNNYWIREWLERYSKNVPNMRWR